MCRSGWERQGIPTHLTHKLTRTHARMHACTHATYIDLITTTVTIIAETGTDERVKQLEAHTLTQTTKSPTHIPTLPFTQTPID